MKSGLEQLKTQPELLKNWGRIGLLCNQASVTRDFTPAWDVLYDIAPKQLTTLFGPQHGFHATVQDNMIETAHATGPFGLPLYSLYSETREPTAPMLENVDTILIDLQIVGCRVYTFKYTIAACLRAAAKYKKKVVLLDRPNPLGGQTIEGKRLNLAARSFVGEFEIPLRHGATPGELAGLFNEKIGADLEVVKISDWDHHAYWHQLSSQWVLTSPNLPTPAATYIYPATVMFEGTNVSEGRGTALPFQLIGAPFLNAKSYKKRIKEFYQEEQGVYFREVEFQPTSQKWAGKTCYGVQLHVLNPDRIETFKLGLALIKAAFDCGGSSFAWAQPGYEYNHTELPINLILGDLAAAKQFEKDSLDAAYWCEGIDHYIKSVKPHLLYERELRPLLHF